MVLLGVVTIVSVPRYLFGNPAVLLPFPDATSAEVEELSQRMGFDQPFGIQYARFIASWSLPAIRVFRVTERESIIAKFIVDKAVKLAEHMKLATVTD